MDRGPLLGTTGVSEVVIHRNAFGAITPDKGRADTKSAGRTEDAQSNVKEPLGHRNEDSFHHLASQSSPTRAEAAKKKTPACISNHG